jgi:hypothetical protein
MQLQTGNLAGTVTDNQGAPLPGVTVTMIPGGGSPQAMETGAGGRYRFSAVMPSTYTVKAALAGFADYENSGVVVNLGRTTELDITLQPAVIS